MNTKQDNSRNIKQDITEVAHKKKTLLGVGKTGQYSRLTKQNITENTQKNGITQGRGASLA